MQREAFSVAVDGGHLHGWTEGAGRPVLVLHGGPGLSADYLADLYSELAGICRVGWYQQRGLEPSTATTPYAVDTQVTDVLAVLDHLGWDRPVVVGHSWGGHLLLHLMARYPGRLGGACVVDPLGAVGDGGMAEFEAELMRRTPEEDRQRVEELDRLLLAGDAGQDAEHESMRLIWASYFPSRETAPPYRPIAMSAAAYAATYDSLVAELPYLADELRGCQVPTAFVHGTASPIPTTASTQTAELLTDVVVELVEGAGHFVWLDRPGAVPESVGRLIARVDGING